MKVIKGEGKYGKESNRRPWCCPATFKDGKSSQTIGAQFGVSRQAIDLYRKEFIRNGLLKAAGVAVNTLALPLSSPPSVPAPPSRLMLLSKQDLCRDLLHRVKFPWTR